MLLRQRELALDAGEGNIEIAHGHLGRPMTEKFHNHRQTGAGSEHFSGKGVASMPHAA